MISYTVVVALWAVALLTSLVIAVVQRDVLGHDFDNEIKQLFEWVGPAYTVLGIGVIMPTAEELAFRVVPVLLGTVIGDTLQLLVLFGVVWVLLHRE